MKVLIAAPAHMNELQQRMPPRLLITVDTETGNFPDGQGLWGRVGNEAWGLVRLLDVFSELDLPATFFLDVYAGNEEDISAQRHAAELIVAAGQDLQLHTHPGPVFDPARIRLRDYTFKEQKEIIEFGCHRIESWTGQRPVLHRAGDWGADHDSLEALLSCGFRADFSASPWSRNCGLDLQLISGNGWSRIDGLLCGVGTCYRDRLTGRTRRVDLGGVSYREVVDVLSRQIDPLFLTLHSFSLLRYNRSRTRFSANPDYVKRLADFCRLAQDQWGYRAYTTIEAVQEIGNCPDTALPWAALPTTHLTASCSGIVKSLTDRLRD